MSLFLSGLLWLGLWIGDGAELAIQGQDTTASQGPLGGRGSRPPGFWRRPPFLEGSDSIRGEHVQMVYWGNDSLQAAGILWFLEESPVLPGLPDSVPSRARVYLAPSEDVFRALTRGQAPEWGAAVTIPRTRTIVIPTYASHRTFGSDRETLILHEWAHLAIHEYLGGLLIPRWFNEGYAKWASGEWNAVDAWRLRIALATGAAPRLTDITLDWPRGRESANIAYMLSATALEYMAKQSGELGIRKFFAHWKEAGSFETAMRSTFGMTTSQFEDRWRKYLKDRYGWLFVLSHSAVFWLFMTLLFLLLFWIRRGRTREQMARLRAADPPDAPAFWQWEEEMRTTNREES